MHALTFVFKMIYKEVNSSYNNLWLKHIQRIPVPVTSSPFEMSSSRYSHIVVEIRHRTVTVRLQHVHVKEVLDLLRIFLGMVEISTRVL